MTPSLAGKTVLVTGAGQGLGEAMALAFAEAGAAVALLSRDEAKLTEVTARIRAEGGRAEMFVADVRSETDVARTVAEFAAKFGTGVDVLVNNAGINLRKPITDFTLAEWNNVIETNLTGTFLMCRAFVPMMRGRG
jgi:NAD(P)-dependent dehydrogenase (short-subunit alcohol dehydrogenase family)